MQISHLFVSSKLLFFMLFEKIITKIHFRLNFIQVILIQFKIYILGTIFGWLNLSGWCMPSKDFYLLLFHSYPFYFFFLKEGFCNHFIQWGKLNFRVNKRIMRLFKSIYFLFIVWDTFLLISKYKFLS
jgi:hypothetical protein